MNYILNVMFQVMDVGVWMFFNWGMDECEMFFQFYEWILGLRMYVVYVCLGGVY